MENVSLADAKVHLEELVQRAVKGDDVRISDPRLGTVRLIGEEHPRVRRPRRLGLLEGKMGVPARLMEPISDEELRDWYGDGP